jgi:hypothetical protein
MLQIIFSIFYFREFFLRAKSGGKNPWKWSLIGGIGFIAATSILPVIFSTIASLLLAIPADNIFLFVACTFGSLIMGVFGANHMLNKKFPKKEADKETNNEQSIGQE